MISLESGVVTKHYNNSRHIEEDSVHVLQSLIE